MTIIPLLHIETLGIRLCCGDADIFAQYKIQHEFFQIQLQLKLQQIASSFAGFKYPVEILSKISSCSNHCFRMCTCFIFCRIYWGLGMFMAIFSFTTLGLRKVYTEEITDDNLSSSKSSIAEDHSESSPLLKSKDN